MLSNTSATVYNRVADRDTDRVSYLRTEIPAVHWEESYAASDKDKSHDRIRSVAALIDFSVCRYMAKQYLPAHEFALLPLSEASQYWTLDCGDIIIKGSVADEIDLSGRKQWLLAHPNAALITAVQTYDMGSPAMQHWEVTAK